MDTAYNPLQELLGKISKSPNPTASQLGAIAPALAQQTPSISYIPVPTELQGMPITPAASIGTNAAAANQRQSTPAPQQQDNQSRPQITQTMMLAAAKKASEDRHAAQIAQYNAARSTSPQR